MRTDLFLDLQPAASIDRLIEALPARALASPRRSTVPLLDYWRSPEARIVDLYRRIGIGEAPAEARLHCEFAVPVRAGRGKPSFTDLMIVTKGSAIAIEAKFTEPRYETVDAWLRGGRGSNRNTVFEGWLTLIRPVAGASINARDLTGLPYQLVHRLASACSIDAPRHALVYQVFGPSTASHYADDLNTLAQAIDAKAKLGIFVLRCPFLPGDAYRALVQRWDEGERDMDLHVRAALTAAPLLSFAEPTLVAIREPS